MTQLSGLIKEQPKPTHIISYDLDYPHSPSTQQAIDKKIKSLGLWSKPLNTFWLINTSLDCEAIKNLILPEILNQ